MASSADVPNKFDLVINGEGYMLDKSYDDSPYRKPPAMYGYTPTFLERTNVGASYGDDQQAFFLTANQNDWSLGGARRFFRSTDADGIRRYWFDLGIDPTIVPGQVVLARQSPSILAATPVASMCGFPSGVYIGGTTHLFLADKTGAATDKGAHGLGAAPSIFGMATDSVNAFLSTTGAGTVGVRRYSGAAFDTFSATACDSLCFLDNILFGYSEATGSLIEYSTGGVASTIFTWQDAKGNALTGSAYRTRLRAFGGVLLLLRQQGANEKQGELWTYNGTDTSQLSAFPANFVAKEMEIVSGIAFFGGFLTTNSNYIPAIYYYDGSTMNLLWKSNVTSFTTATWPSLAPYGDGIVFNDDTTGSLLQYDIRIGGIHSLGAAATDGNPPLMAANKDILVYSTTAGQHTQFYPSATTLTTGYLITSLFDFDNSLPKLMRGVKIEWDAGSDGDGGSIDIYYQFDSVDGAWTLLQAAAVSGTEYNLGTTPHHSVAFKLVLNKGTSTYGPKLKRIFARAAPVLNTYRNNQYLLDLTGNQMADPSLFLTLADGTTHTKDGEQMRKDLVTALLAGPISITDRFGTYTGIIEPANTDFREVRSDYGRAEYRADIQIREI